MRKMDKDESDDETGVFPEAGNLNCVCHGGRVGSDWFYSVPRCMGICFRQAERGVLMPVYPVL